MKFSGAAAVYRHTYCIIRETLQCRKGHRNMRVTKTSAPGLSGRCGRDADRGRFRKKQTFSGKMDEVKSAKRNFRAGYVDDRFVE